MRGTGAVEARTERKCTLAGAGDRGARLRLACRVGGPGRMPPGHGQPLSFRLERSRSKAHRSCAICVPERQEHHGRQGAGATSTRLPATGAAIWVFSLSAMPTRPHCGHGCGGDQVVHKENDVTPVRYVLHLVDLGSTISPLAKAAPPSKVRRAVCGSRFASQRIRLARTDRGPFATIVLKIENAGVPLSSRCLDCLPQPFEK